MAIEARTVVTAAGMTNRGVGNVFSPEQMCATVALVMQPHLMEGWIRLAVSALTICWRLRS